ncbi:MAG: isoprenylcysteine carboxylmethyltransferase family protein [Acidobacteria bacterium]|nr:isoprenylcysteine carboxylmethyltransferase family protein [Acidobacteriota bacterium]
MARAVPLFPPRLEGERRGFAGRHLLAGLAFGGAFFTFVRAKTTPHPNHPVSASSRGGPTEFSGNPLYVRLSVGFVGIALVANTPWVLVALPLVWLALRRLVIGREEAYLERRFGDEYRAFKARTRRWL